MTKDVSKKNDKKDATQKIEGIICRLKSKRLQMPDVPEEFRMHPDILRAERKLEIRKSGHRGFDVIRQLFFVEETWRYKNRAGEYVSREHTEEFDSFQEYYAFVDGDIYEDACYYQCLFDDELIAAFQLDLEKLMARKCFETQTIDEFIALEKPESGDCPEKPEIMKAYFCSAFHIGVFWYNQDGEKIKQAEREFKYFFDFAAFLKGDLSDADLLFCDGIKHLSDTQGLNLTDARLTSELCEKFGIAYLTYEADEELLQTFPQTEANEKETALILKESRELAENSEEECWSNENRIRYISDLHLNQRIQNAKCKSIDDVCYTMQKIVDTIVRESYGLTLIAGDVASDFRLFKLFVRILNRSAYTSCQQYVFVLGNHELWSFAGKTVRQIVNTYRKLLEEHGMYLLQNDLFYKNDKDDMGMIPYTKLMRMNQEELCAKLRRARWVILGGIGFSGYNEEFNADTGIYRNTIDRKTEIKETQKFEKLYNRLTGMLKGKNTIILTHMPKENWCADKEYHESFVYVSGHTHRNAFYDDGAIRVYAENQIGYHNDNVHLRSFLLDGKYDYFTDYKDGIYEITKEEYQDFMHGKNITMQFNREVEAIYMLKKIGYYCFLCREKTGRVVLLNGGRATTTCIDQLEYYYDHMDRMVAEIQKPLRLFTAYQEQIAKAVRQIGGSGRIHGCIIDIDYYNHLYINLNDISVTPYWASDMVNKRVYPSIPALLKKECPHLYENYKKLISSDEKNALSIRNAKAISEKPTVYLETDIYKTSRKISELQKVNSNILVKWYAHVLAGEQDTVEKLEK